MIIDLNIVSNSSEFVTNESFIFLGALLTGITAFLSSLAIWFIKKFTLVTFKLTIYYGVIYTSYAISIAVVVFTVNLVLALHDVIMSLLSTIETFGSSSGGSCLSTNIIAGINASGLMEGIIAGMPLINSAFAFFILTVFYIFLVKIRVQFTSYVLGSLKLIGN